MNKKVQKRIITGIAVVAIAGILVSIILPSLANF